MSLTDIEREYLSTQRLGRLATVGPKGDPQNNPVGFWYNAETGTIDIRGWNLAKSRKYRNLRDNDQVAFVGMPRRDVRLAAGGVPGLIRLPVSSARPS